MCTSFYSNQMVAEENPTTLEYHEDNLHDSPRRKTPISAQPKHDWESMITSSSGIPGGGDYSRWSLTWNAAVNPIKTGTCINASRDDGDEEKSAWRLAISLPKSHFCQQMFAQFNIAHEFNSHRVHFLYDVHTRSASIYNMHECINIHKHSLFIVYCTLCCKSTSQTIFIKVLNCKTAWGPVPRLWQNINFVLAE